MQQSRIKLNTEKNRISVVNLIKKRKNSSSIWKRTKSKVINCFGKL